MAIKIDEKKRAAAAKGGRLAGAAISGMAQAAGVVVLTAAAVGLGDETAVRIAAGVLAFMSLSTVSARIVADRIKGANDGGKAARKRERRKAALAETLRRQGRDSYAESVARALALAKEQCGDLAN